MTDVGFQKDFIDTQKAILTNITDAARTYIQLTDLVMDLDSNVTKHQLTNNTIDNVFSLSISSVQGNMWLTTNEWLLLVGLLVDSNGVRPIKSWKLEWTDQSNVTKTTTFVAQMKTLRPIDSGIGAIKLFFRLELNESVVLS